ncbi:MAG: carboxypeptidase regulatory-like domain-containing protein [Bacteroidota bacterium]
MKHIFQSILMLAILATSIQLPAQSTLKKANKEYELYAFSLAIKSYRKVLDKDPNNVVALARIAECYRQLNQIDDALSWYEKAVQQKGIDPLHLFNYAKTLMNKGQYEKAKEWFLLYAEGQPVFGNHYAENCDFALSMRGVKPLYRVKNEYANSSASDFGATFFGQKVIYSSSRTDIPRSNNSSAGTDWMGNAANQLYLTSRDDKSFLKLPKHLRSDIHNEFNEGPLSYSEDGKWVAYTKNNFVEGTRQIPSSGIELSIYIAEADAGGDWNNSRPFDFNGSGYSSGYPAFADNGNTLYFASNRPDGYGGYDIYVTRRTGNTWSTPANLGPVINSPGNEISPYIDGNSLYFSSDWHQGLGGMDIFRAERLAGDWAKVFHLGNGVNSSRDDYNFVFDNNNNIGYFTSNRLGGKGREDIYQVTRMTDKLEIYVLDAKDRSPIAGASLDFSDCSESVYATNSAGMYSFQALEGLDCKVMVSKKGYDSFALNIRSTGKRKTRSFEVTLNKEADKLIGRVLNSTDNSSVADVFIRATDRNTGDKLETRTDANGAYSLALRDNTSYIIRYSKAGFLDTQNAIQTRDGSDKSLLGVIMFRPAVTSIESPVVANPSPSPTTGGPGSIPPPPSIDDNTTIDDSATASTDETATEPPPSSPAIEEGFSVQIAAVYANRKADITKYRKLNSIGNLYSRTEKGYKKFRIGIYATREAAVEAQQKLRAEGYKSAFIVAEDLERTSGVEFYGPPTEPATSPANDYSYEEEQPKVEDQPAPPVPKATSNQSPYKVRLAAYKNPQFFNKNAVEGLGDLEMQSKGDFTIMLLGGFANLDEAIAVRQKAIDSGFKGAFVVIDEEGRLVKVNL